MAITESATAGSARLQKLARRDLWLHFTRHRAYDPEHPIQVIARGGGCCVWETEAVLRPVLEEACDRVL